LPSPRYQHEKLIGREAREEAEMDERNEQDDAQVDEDALKDLDIDQDDADKVIGGRRGDPCEGGE
jgi:hypothetical protein